MQKGRLLTPNGVGDGPDANYLLPTALASALWARARVPGLGLAARRVFPPEGVPGVGLPELVILDAHADTSGNSQAAVDAVGCDLPSALLAVALVATPAPVKALACVVVLANPLVIVDDLGHDELASDGVDLEVGCNEVEPPVQHSRSVALELILQPRLSDLLVDVTEEAQLVEGTVEVPLVVEPSRRLIFGGADCFAHVICPIRRSKCSHTDSVVDTRTSGC